MLTINRDPPWALIREVASIPPLELVNEAEVALGDGDPAAIERAHERLLACHWVRHSRNRPPDLNCTGCRIWPLIVQMRERLGVEL
jgi:hypothetical protein